MVLGIAFLSGCQTPGERKVSYPTVIARSGDSQGFPRQAAGFSRGNTVSYEPGMKNTSVGYNFFTPSAQQAVTFYFYPKSQPFAQQIDSEKKMIEQVQEEATVLNETEQAINRGKRTFQSHTVNYQIKGIILGKKQVLYSQLLLIELPERYVKVRSTSPLAQADKANRRLLDLLEQIDWTKTP